ncbi:hypothetical protein HW555_007836 [Spodoptera exigua]|uniref:Uncharacterized protein n=1 Tax=Spodoptera exigua TaxID=7107 RepID=A0A835L8H4_SPOEX|nr:hypothetical protein HW555_007836 [Spodoptera exigua]
MKNDEPPLDPCEIQRKKKALAAKKKCVKKVVCEPPKEPEKVKKCFKEPPCLCLERIKNLPIDASTLKSDQAILEDLRFTCVVRPQLPGQSRCEKIRELETNHPDTSLPNCEPPPPPPPPPKLDPCEQQKRRAKIAELNLEIPIDSEDDLIDSRRLTIHPVNNRCETSTNSCNNFDKELTELENLIKKLQCEIGEMAKYSNKPVSKCKNIVDDKDCGNKVDVKDCVLIKDEGVLEQQAKKFTGNMSNSIKISGPENDTLDDVRRNFSMLWDDETTNSIEDATEDIMTINDCPPKPLNDPSFKPSDNPKIHLINNDLIDSFDNSNTINTQQELGVNFPVDLKHSSSIHKTNDDNTPTKVNDPNSTEFCEKALTVSEKCNPTTIMHSESSGNQLKDNTKILNHEKDSSATVTVIDKSKEIKTEKTDLHNAMQNAISSTNEKTSIPKNPMNNPPVAEKCSAKSESFSIIKTLRRIVGKESVKSIQKEKQSQDQESLTDSSKKIDNSTSKKDSFIIKEDPKIDTKIIKPAIAQDVLPKLSNKDSDHKEIQHNPSSTVTKSDINEETSKTTEFNPTSNIEIKPVIVNKLLSEKPVPSAPSANSNDLVKLTTNSASQTIVPVNAKRTNQKPQEISNEISNINSVQDPNPVADISTSHVTIPDGFNKNLVIEDAKTILRHATNDAVKRSEAIENHGAVTDGLAEGDIHYKCDDFFCPPVALRSVGLRAQAWATNPHGSQPGGCLTHPVHRLHDFSNAFVQVARNSSFELRSSFV